MKPIPIPICIVHRLIVEPKQCIDFERDERAALFFPRSKYTGVLEVFEPHAQGRGPVSQKVYTGSAYKFPLIVKEIEYTLLAVQGEKAIQRRIIHAFAQKVFLKDFAMHCTEGKPLIETTTLRNELGENEARAVLGIQNSIRLAWKFA